MVQKFERHPQLKIDIEVKKHIVMCLCDVIDSPVWSDSPKRINFHLVCPADPSGWWFGRLRGREGMFPGNYVEKM